MRLQQKNIKLSVSLYNCFCFVFRYNGAKVTVLPVTERTHPLDISSFNDSGE